MIETPHTWIEISKKALLWNLNHYKKAIGDQALGIVVKSNAYGHGIAEVSRICQESPDVDWLFTATLSEALLLRSHGITKPILVIYFIDDSPLKALEYSISLMVSDSKTLHELNAIARSVHKKFKVHIKIDSGMSRFGFAPQSTLIMVKEALLLPGIVVEGIYSHLAQAANSDQTFSKEQESVFLAVLEELQKAHIEIPFRHIANSAGATSLINDHTNLVRIGLGAYGWWPSQSNKELTQLKNPDFELKPVLTFKTRIFQIRHLEADRCVGYDRTYKTTSPTRIAVLPVGYYDGYDRRLSSKGILLIRGSYAPVIGIIAMTTTLVDITHIPDAQEGDEAILMGNYEQITPTHLANVIGSFNAREIMTRLNPLIARIEVI
jgi:alanine racemase